MQRDERLPLDDHRRARVQLAVGHEQADAPVQLGAPRVDRKEFLLVKTLHKLGARVASRVARLSYTV